jgi:hypothetical protein
MGLHGLTMHHQKTIQGQTGLATAVTTGRLSAQCKSQSSKQDKGKSDLIEKANDSPNYLEQHGTESSLVAAPTEGWFLRPLSERDHG